MVLHLKGKTALVTGASIGIGRVIAKALASKGVQVVAVARRTELLPVVDAAGNGIGVLHLGDLVNPDGEDAPDAAPDTH